MQAFGQYEAKLVALNAQLARMLSLTKATDAAGFARMNAAATQASKTFRDAAASTGQFEVQQLRLNSATDDYVKSLRAQKSSFRDMAKQRKIAAAAYKEQLAMENMTVRKNVNSNSHNKGVYDVIVPTKVSQDLDTAGKRLAFMNAELKSGAHQMVNWGKNTQWAGRQLMVGFTMPIAAFGAAAGVMAYQVDKELTRIAKVYDTVATESMAVEKELAQVRKDSLKTAATGATEYGQSATDTLNVQAELAATGKQGVELQKSTLEVMRIARLGEVEHQTAIDATIALQSVFRMSNEELTESFDYMNSIENATSLSTKDFATAIPVAASAVKAFGGDVKEMGILLTAMKENGIGASEGANALKATMQRLGRPSKQIREEWQQLTGTDITKLVDDSDGLVEVFTKIQEATVNLNPDDQRKAFAGLFGSYQVSKMMALTKGMGELKEGVGQVSQAYAISNQSAESWAETAEKEIGRYQQSISGMWDIAFQSMKVELAEVGEPFVVLATQIVKSISWIIKAFNNLPDMAKMFIAGGIALAALSGGVLMLAGLMGNLAGNVLKGIGNLAAFALKIDLVDKNTKAAQLATELATHSYLDQAKAVDLLTMQLNQLTAAQVESNAVMLRHDPAYVGGGAGATNPQMVAMARENKQREQIVGSMKSIDGNGAPVYHSPGGIEINRDQAVLMANNTLRQDALDMEDKMKQTATEAESVNKKRLETDTKRKKIMGGTAALLAVEAASMGTMMLSSNETAQSAAQFAMVAAIAAPAVVAMAPAAKTAGTHMKGLAKSAVGATKSSALFATGMRGAGASVMGMMGPVGWTIAALTAGAGILYTWYQHEKKMREQAISDHHELNTLAEDYATAAGKTVQEYKTLAGVMDNLKPIERTNLEKDVEYFKNDEEGGGGKKLDAFERLDDNFAKAKYAQQMFIDLQVRSGYTAGRAATAVMALYEAAGEGASTAAGITENLLDSLGTIRNDDWHQILMTELMDLKGKMGDDFIDVDDIASEDDLKRITGLFSEAMANARPGEGKQIMADFEEIVTSGWENIWTKISEDEGAMAIMRENGIDSMKEYQAWYASASDVERMDPFGVNRIAPGIGEGTAAAAALEQQFIEVYGAMVPIGPGIKTWASLQKNVAMQAKALNYKDATGQMNSLIASTKTQGARGAENTEESALFAMNLFLAARGYKTASSTAEALQIWTDRIKDDTKGAAAGAGGIGLGLNKAIGPARTLAAALKQLNAEQVLAAKREAIEGMQSDMADNITGQMDDQHESAMDANQTYWDGEMEAQDARFDNQTDALDAQQERAQRGFDAAWDAKRDGLENYWDARIEGIENAIKAEEEAEKKRVKMFDAEIARINRLAELANTNIDFNIALNEGNLDEAAKISNTIQARDEEFVMNSARDAGSDKSAKRVDKLGKKQEGLEEGKENAMEAFEKREEAAKAHFDRMQEMQKENLQKEQDNKKKSLQVEADLSKKALEKDHERQKKNLERVLDTFLSFTPRNKKELQKHAAELGKALKDFGITTLNPMSVKWGEWYKNNISRGMINAANVSASDGAWAALAGKIKQDILDELGFGTEARYNNFMKTGRLNGDATDGGALYGAEKAEALLAAKGEKNGPQNSRTVVSQHSGGMVGARGVDSRSGVAKNYKGQHPSERLINAQRGEYIINRKDATKHKGVLDQINTGRFVGGKQGPGGYMAGLLMAGMLKGVGKNLAAKLEKKKARKALKAASASSMGGQGQFAAGNYVAGQGGWQRPSVPGLGWSNTHDYRTPTGTPVYATSDGVITRSHATTSGGSPGNGGIAPNGLPYRSYGETIQLRMADGNHMNFGHLSARYVGVNQPVTGGSLIGRTGNTGNSTGPHLHMDLNPSENASGYLSSRGISLKKGAQYVKFDNTMANLHRGESVLTKNLTEKMHQGVERFAKGDNSEYNVEVNINGYNGDADALAELVVKKIQRNVARRPQSRSV